MMSPQDVASPTIDLEDVQSGNCDDQEEEESWLEEINYWKQVEL